MDIDSPQILLGGLSAATFMHRHWHKKPLLVRQALPGAARLLTPQRLLALAGSDAVQSRLIERRAGDDTGDNTGSAFTVRHGPFARRNLPALRRSGWTVLVQGVDLADAAMHGLMQQFRFVPDARLDDVMVSFATDQGGVGAHVDSYDVFLLQLHGRRRWRVGRQKDRALLPGSALKILAHFTPEQEWVLEPGDMLYLPPQWAHEGIAQGPCMTCSIGFRAPARDALARELLLRLSESDATQDGPLYRDPRQRAVAHPGAIPPALREFARAAVQRALADTQALDQVLGEILSEPKPHVFFDAPQEENAAGDNRGAGVVLDRRTRMLYDMHHIFINGESWRASGRDMDLLRRLADCRALAPDAVHSASAQARALLAQWCAAGWLLRTC